MPDQTITADVCSKMVESATRSCQPMISLPPEQANPNWDAMAASFASLSNAFAWGSLILAGVAIIAAFTWGKIVTERAEREAREMAKAKVERWLQDDALPLILREVSEFLRTFPMERPISEDDVDAMTAAAGANEDGKEGGDGKEK